MLRIDGIVGRAVIGRLGNANPKTTVDINVGKEQLRTTIAIGAASFALTALHRLRHSAAERLRTGDVSSMLDRDDILIVDTETTGIGPHAEVIEIVAIDTTGALRLSKLSLPCGAVSTGSQRMHGLDAEALNAAGARPWPEVHGEAAAVLASAQRVLAWRADSDIRFIAQTCARHRLAPPAVRWADVRPAYVEARPGGRHGLASAMQREGLAWEGEHHRAEADCRAVLGVIRAIAR